jgi:chemotaxis protein MotB
MFRKDKSEEESNFWISYADLMAGLLFVFILLIGAIISKSVMVKSVLHEKENSLEKSLQLVNEKESYILKKDKLITQLESNLKTNKDSMYKNQLVLKSKNERLAKATLLLSKNERLVKLRLSEISELNKKLLLANTQVDTLNKKVVIVQTMLENNASEHNTATKKIQEYEGKVLVLSNALTNEKEQVKLKDEKLLSLLSAMGEQKTKYDSLLENLQKQKQKIKRLTGIKLQVIAALKKSLGSQIHIDKKTGSLKLASNILFEVGKSRLKDGAKKELKKAFEEYIGTLVTDELIKPYLDKIIIEGHTDSDGEYIYNLKLSQDRALAVMEYLLTLNFSKKHNIKSLVIASGRSYLDTIKNKGIEDKEASRRIEIKFRLKNEDAMQEIEKVLDEG